MVVKSVLERERHLFDRFYKLSEDALGDRDSGGDRGIGNIIKVRCLNVIQQGCSCLCLDIKGRLPRCLRGIRSLAFALPNLWLCLFVVVVVAPT